MVLHEDGDTMMGEGSTHDLIADSSATRESNALYGFDPSIAPPLLGPSTGTSWKSPLEPQPSRKLNDLSTTLTSSEAFPFSETPIETVESTTAPAATSFAKSEVKVEEDGIVDENSDWSEDVHAPADKGLERALLSSGLCYDIRMRYHCEVRPTADVHPEDPRRIY